MTDVLLVTEQRLPDGEPGGELLVPALAARGLTARWVCWDDPDVDWSSARVVSARSPWDYMYRLDDFLAWARAVGPTLLNGAEVFEWNTDKGYLLDLESAGVTVVPTIRVADRSDLDAAVSSFDGRVVVKPAVGGGGFGLTLVQSVGELADVELDPPPWVVQPVVESVSTEGEVSVFVLGGRAVAQVCKWPAGSSDIRVHEHFGGRTEPVTLTAEAATLSVTCVEAAESLLGRRLTYARLDLLRLADGRLAVSELEVTEPGLYLDVLPENADRFADLVVRVLTGDEDEAGPVEK